MRSAFTLIETLVVVAILAILAALIVPGLTRAKANAKRTTCLANLKQLDAALLMYADDSNDIPPSAGQSTNQTTLMSGYTKLLQPYVGASGPTTAAQGLFSCPSDTFYYRMTSATGLEYFSGSRNAQPFATYSSYSFNGRNQDASEPAYAFPGIGGIRLASVKHQAKTVTLAEAPAFFPYSWHQPRLPADNELPWFNDAKNTVAFADGHVRYIKMYWNTNLVADGKGFAYTLASDYDPPPNYEYQWSAE